MRIIYDTATDTLVLFLSERPVVDNFAAGETTVVEFDSDQAPATITMTNASSRVDLRNVSVEGINITGVSLHG